MCMCVGVQPVCERGFVIISNPILILSPAESPKGYAAQLNHSHLCPPHGGDPRRIRGKFRPEQISAETEPRAKVARGHEEGGAPRAHFHELGVDSYGVVVPERCVYVCVCVCVCIGGGVHRMSVSAEMKHVQR